MDWTLAIDRNRTALLRLLATLFAAAGLVSGRSVAMLPRHARLTVLRDLRSAESALRRLIVIAARSLVVALRPSRTAPTRPIPQGDGSHAPSFPLFDPRKPIGGRAPVPVYAPGPGPRISVFGWDEPVFEPVTPVQPPSPDDPVDAAGVWRRLEVLKRTLDDLPKQALRLARAQARASTRCPRRPMRPGRPPGYRARGKREIDTVLIDCHQLALMAMDAPDTS